MYQYVSNKGSFILKFLKATFIFIVMANAVIAQAEYTYYHDKELDELLGKNPSEILIHTETLLKESIQNNDINKQLIALFYMAEYHNEFSNFEEFEETYTKGLNLAIKHNQLVFQAEFLIFKISDIEIQGKYTEALNLANEAVEIAKSSENEQIIASAIASRANIFNSLGNHQKAISELFFSLNIFKQNNDRLRLSIYYNLLAIVYSNLKDHEKAIKYLEESLKYDDIKATHTLAVHYFNLGFFQLHQKKYDLSISNLLTAKEISDESSMIFINYALSIAYRGINQFNKAEELLIDSIKYFNSDDELKMHFNYNVLLSELYAEKKEFSKIEPFLKKAESQLETLNTDYDRLDLLRTKIFIHEKQGHWQQAHELSKERYKLEIKAINEDNKASLDEAKIQFDAKFDQEKIALLEKQNQLQQKSIEQEKNIKKYLGAIVVLAILATIMTFLAYFRQRKNKQQYYRLSHTDELTGIANRRSIISQLESFISTPDNSHLPFSVAMLDLDHFKKINDTFGHELGNDVLIHFAKCVKNLINELGVIGRIGGEEWLILLPNYDEEKIKQLLFQIREKYNTPLLLELPESYQMTFSSGVIICGEKCKDRSVILKIVDESLYKAKHNGRNQDVITHF